MRKNYPSNRKPSGYWTVLENAKTEALTIMEREGWTTLPGAPTLAEKGYSSLSLAISTKHGGFPKFRDLLGQNNSFGRWKDLGYALNQARKAMAENDWDTLPSENVLKIKYSGLIHAITTHHGRMRRFRELLGQDQMRATKGTVKSLDYVIAETQRIMAENEWEELPFRRLLKNKGYGSIAKAIEKYHGGFPYFRELLQKRMGGKTESDRLTSLLEQYVHGGNE